MLYSISKGTTVAFAVILAAGVMMAGGAAQAADPTDPGVVNRGVVEIETGRASDVSVHMAEDMAGLIDDGATRRLLPVVGKGALQTLADLRYMRGIDLAIVPVDALDYAKEQNFLPGLSSTLTYVAKLYNEEFHLLVGPSIKNIADLANQKINVDVQGSATAVTATRLFALLQLKPDMTTDTEDVALQKLMRGEIAAAAFVGAKPVPFLREIASANGLHLLEVPLTRAVLGAYPPTRITSYDYPGLVAPGHPVDTIAVGSVLLAADLRGTPDRNRHVADMVETLFTDFQTLLGPGHQAKWHEVNIAAELPNWVRYPPAQQWLQRNAQLAAAQNPDDLKALFAQFIDERRQASGRGPMSAQEKDALFEQFRAWERGKAQ